jgi:hypothetical protein
MDISHVMAEAVSRHSLTAEDLVQSQANLRRVWRNEFALGQDFHQVFWFFPW